MAFRKISFGEEDIETQIVIWVHKDGENLIADMHHPMETSTLVGQPLEKVVDIASQQKEITPGNPEVVVIDEGNHWPKSYLPLI